MPKQAQWYIKYFIGPEINAINLQICPLKIPVPLFNNYNYPFLVDFAGLKFLVRICTDLGLKDVQDYAQKLKKAEKARELKQQVN